MSPPDHPAAAIVTLGLVVLPLLVVTVGVMAVVIVSLCSGTDTRRKHSRRLLHDLTEYARAVRGWK